MNRPRPLWKATFVDIAALIAFLAMLAVACVQLMIWWRSEATYSALKGHIYHLHAYHEEHGAFPPQQWTNGFGVTFSYRVLLMKYMDSKDAQQVAADAWKVKSIAELEATEPYQRWSRGDYVSGLLANLTYVPVEGPWLTWGNPLQASLEEKWNGDRVPLVAGIRVPCDSWCAPSPPVHVDDSAILSESYHQSGSAMVVGTDGAVHSVTLKPSR